jgi:hypothetical protein
MALADKVFVPLFLLRTIKMLGWLSNPNRLMLSSNTNLNGTIFPPGKLLVVDVALLYSRIRLNEHVKNLYMFNRFSIP